MSEFKFAEIEIRKSGDIFSPDFNDIYFSSAGGYLESIHVFMEPNNIPQRFFNQSEISIFEAGFGTGLNFLIAVRFFLQFASPSAKMEFTSFEKFPIKHDDLEKIFRFFIYLRPECEIFIKEYKKLELKKGENRIPLYNGRIILNLIIDDISNTSSYLKDNNFDAWFLDGFNPSTNPEMWTNDFFEIMGRKSNDGASFSTFSAAGFVRRGLAEHGFKIKKTKGYNRKREMLTGTFVNPNL